MSELLPFQDELLNCLRFWRCGRLRNHIGRFYERDDMPLALGYLARSGGLVDAPVCTITGKTNDMSFAQMGLKPIPQKKPEIELSLDICSDPPSR